ITANDTDELLVDSIISANLSGSADLFKQNSGQLLLSGSNSGFSGTVFLTSANPRFNQASVLVGSDTALGTGVVFPASGLQLGSDGGPHTLANRFITQDLRLSGGNDLTLAGPLDLNSGATYTVFAPINFTLAGGVGEFTPNSGITKNGPGFLNL